MVVTLGCGILITTRVIPPRLNHFVAPTLNEWDFLRDRTPDFDKSGIGIYPLKADRPKLALFIGDSHIAQYAARIDKTIVSDPERPGAILAIGGGCIPIEGAFTYNIRRKKCWPLRKSAYKMALDKRFETIVIGAAWNWYFFSRSYVYINDGKAIPLSSRAGRDAAINRLGERIRALIKAQKRVVLVLDNPISSLQNLNSIGKSLRLSFSVKSPPPNSAIRVDEKQLALNRQLLGLAKRTGAIVINPFSVVCTETICRVTDETGRPIYKDNGHFNPDWLIDHGDFMDIATATNR